MDKIKNQKLGFKTGDVVYLKQKEYRIWAYLKKFGYVKMSIPYLNMAKDIDYDTPGIIKGFQNPIYDDRDIIIRWANFLWNTTIPSQFLTKNKEI